MARTAAVALVDAQNAPLFLKRFDAGEDLDLLFTVHSALDSFEETMLPGRKAARKSYLGLLNLIDGQAVYGFLSNTLVKTIVVLDVAASGFAVPSDTVMEDLLKRLYNCYVATISNPFFELGTPLQAPSAKGGDAPAAGSHEAQLELQRSFERRISAVVQAAVIA